MALNLDGIELDEEIKAKLLAQNEGVKTQAEVEEELAGLKAKRDELLAAERAAKDKRLAAEEAAEAERLSKLQNEKKYKELAESYEEKLAAMDAKAAAQERKAQELTLKNKAVEMAKEISEGDAADLLADFMQRRLTIEDGEIKVTDGSGALTINKPSDLIEEFKKNPKYASLVSVTKASGGQGGKASHQETKQKDTGKPQKGAIDMDAARDKIKANLEKQNIPV